MKVDAEDSLDKRSGLLRGSTEPTCPLLWILGNILQKAFATYLDGKSIQDQEQGARNRDPVPDRR